MGKDLELKLVKSGDFLGTKCDFYKDEDNDNIYMTRKQIGEALEYKSPDDSIYRIHNRNQDRLDNFSTSVKLSSVEGSRMVARDTIVYTERGIYDITRFSRQPVADEFYDWVYEQVSMMRRYGAAIPDMELAIEEVFFGLDKEVQTTIVKNYKEKLIEANEALEAAKPKVERWEAFMDSDGHLSMLQFSRGLGIESLGRNNLMQLLRDKGVLMKGNNHNLPYQQYMDRGYFRSILTEKNGQKYNVSLLTAKGVEWLHKKLGDWGLLGEQA